MQNKPTCRLRLLISEHDLQTNEEVGKQVWTWIDLYNNLPNTLEAALCLAASDSVPLVLKVLEENQKNR